MSVLEIRACFTVMDRTEEEGGPLPCCWSGEGGCDRPATIIHVADYGGEEPERVLHLRCDEHAQHV